MKKIKFGLPKKPGVYKRNKIGLWVKHNPFKKIKKK